MDVEQLVAGLGQRGAIERRSDGWWAVWPELDVRAMATRMISQRVRLSTVTGVPARDGGLRLIYHWDLGATVLNLETQTRDGHIPTISDLLPAADWVEREIRDYYGVTFDGRDETAPLMLRADDAPGFFCRTGDLGRTVDPAEEAHHSTQHEEIR